MKFALLFFLFVTVVHAKQQPVILGDSTVIIHTIGHGEGKTFVHLHQNEVTALKAALAVIRKEGGRVLTLEHAGQRNIVFHLNQHRYEFDPNRIFTEKGIKKTLIQFGPYSPFAHAEVKKLSTRIKALLPEGKIIAVHNNQSYSLKNYLPGRALAADAKALNVSTSRYFRNFYLVTQKKDYVRLKDMKFNSVLQTKTPSDDGSLSVYLAGSQYVNVEAGFDQLSAQIYMLKYA